MRGHEDAAVAEDPRRMASHRDVRDGAFCSGGKPARGMLNGHWSRESSYFVFAGGCLLVGAYPRQVVEIWMRGIELRRRGR